MAKKRRITYELARKICLQHRTRCSLRRADEYIYQWVRRHELEDELFSHFQRAQFRISYEMAKQVALQCRTRVELRERFKSIYEWIRIHKHFHLLDHLERSQRRSNVFYIYRIVGYQDIVDLYKVGLTTTQSNLTRIRKVANKMQAAVADLYMAEFPPGVARKVEAEVLKMGWNPKCWQGDGQSELRIFNSLEYLHVFEIVNMFYDGSLGSERIEKTFEELE